MAEDKEKKNAHGDGCMCMGCGGGMGMGAWGGRGMMGRGHHWTFFLLRTLITVLILMLVFWFGVQVGRMNGYGRGGYGMMRTGMSQRITGYNPGGPMIPAGATSSPVQGL